MGDGTKPRASLIVARAAIILGTASVLGAFAIRGVVLHQCWPVASEATGRVEAVLVNGQTCFIAPWVGQTRGILLTVGLLLGAAGLIADRILSHHDHDGRRSA